MPSEPSALKIKLLYSTQLPKNTDFRRNAKVSLFSTQETNGEFFFMIPIYISYTIDDLRF